MKVPKGLKGGDTFIFEMPKTKKTTQSKKEQQRATVTPTKTEPSLWDIELVNIKDFGMAIVCALLITFSIAMGFMCGILFVTRDDPDAYPK